MLTKLHNANPSGKAKEKITKYIVDNYEEVAAQGLNIVATPFSSLGELALLPTQLFQEINVALNLNILSAIRTFQVQLSSCGTTSASIPSNPFNSPQTPKTPGGTISLPPITTWGSTMSPILSYPPDFLRGANSPPTNDFL